MRDIVIRVFFFSSATKNHTTAPSTGIIVLQHVEHKHLYSSTFVFCVIKLRLYIKLTKQ